MPSNNYNFDEIIERRDLNAVVLHGFKNYLFSESQTSEFTCSDADLLPMWIADMAFASAPEIVEAIRKRLDNPVFGYTKLFDPEYFTTFSIWTRSRYGWECKEEELLLSSGVIPALYELVDYLCEPDEKIIAFTPSYAYFKRAADFHNIEIIYSPLINNQNNYVMDLDDFKEKVKDPKVKLCIFCHPHNPTTPQVDYGQKQN